MNIGTVLIWFATLACSPSSAFQRAQVIQPEQRNGPGANHTGLSPECRKLEALRNQTEELFLKSPNREEYYNRNWMWVRCRTAFHNEFDAGGSWFGPYAEDLRRRLEDSHCVWYNWHFKYINSRGWGDAMFGFNWASPRCHQQDTVDIMRKVAKIAADRYQREFYIWDCPGAETDPNWDSESMGKPVPKKEADAGGVPPPPPPPPPQGGDP